jgi:hypothetical protein
LDSLVDDESGKKYNGIKYAASAFQEKLCKANGATLKSITVAVWTVIAVFD